MAEQAGEAVVCRARRSAQVAGERRWLELESRGMGRRRWPEPESRGRGRWWLPEPRERTAVAEPRRSAGGEQGSGAVAEREGAAVAGGSGRRVAVVRPGRRRIARWRAREEGAR